MSRLIADGDYGINELQQICLNQAKEKGFNNPTFNEMIALLHSEISEAYEEWRDGHGVNEIYFKATDVTENSFTQGKPEGIPIEFADLAIRLFHYCGFLNIDLASAIKQKLAYNATRPYRHGNKKA